MQVVSGRIDRPKVHFEAPPRRVLESELSRFFDWFTQSKDDPKFDPLLRAAISHFWFVTLHPFDDGNGRLTRAITDLALAQADAQSIRLYAMSSVYLGKPEKLITQFWKSPSVGIWILPPGCCGFLDMLEETITVSLTKIDRTLQKTRFWQQFYDAGLSDEQVKVFEPVTEWWRK